MIQAQTYNVDLNGASDLNDVFEKLELQKQQREDVRNDVLECLNLRRWYSPVSWHPGIRQVFDYGKWWTARRQVAKNWDRNIHQFYAMFPEAELFGKFDHVKWQCDEEWDEAVFWGVYHGRKWNIADKLTELRRPDTKSN